MDAKDKQIQSALETQRRAELLNKSRIENIVPPQSPVDKGMQIPNLQPANPTIPPAPTPPDTMWGYNPQIDNPKQCPNCKRMDWNRDKKKR